MLNKICTRCNQFFIQDTNSIILLKYSSSGALIWSRRSDTASEGSIWCGVAVSAEAGGAVYVTGSSTSSLNQQMHAGSLSFAPNVYEHTCMNTRV